jgi:hypothetical protein
MTTKEEIRNGILNKLIISDGGLKDLVVDYVGTKLNPENEEVTLEMVIGVLADEFPEVVLAIAEENFLRGYSVGLDDASASDVRETKIDV